MTTHEVSQIIYRLSSSRRVLTGTILLLTLFMNIPGKGYQVPVGDLTSNWFPIFPKEKGLLIEQTESDKRETEPRDVAYPDGKHPVIYASGIEGEYFKIAHPKIGRVKISSFYLILRN